MSALSVQVPFPVFQDRDGQPLENGYVWIGTANLYPITNAVPVFFDAALTIPAAQPLRTINGYISNAGTPAQIYVDGVSFSILVQDSKGSMVYNFPDGSGISPNAAGVAFTGFKGQGGFVSDLADNEGSDWIGFLQAGTGAVAVSAQDKMRQIVSVKDFGAAGDGVTDDSGAVTAALAALFASDGNALFFPDGTYYFASTVTITFPAQLSNRGVRLLGTSMPGFVSARPGGSRITGASGLTSLFTITKTTPTSAGGYSFECENIDFDGNAKGVGSAILNLMGGAPVRPFNVRSCNFRRFQRAISSDISATGLTTGICQVNIEGCNFQGNDYGLHGKGQSAIMDLRFVGNVCEQNTLGGIYTEPVANGSLGSSFIISDNLLEGQPDAIVIDGGQVSGEISRNYFEANTSYLINVSATNSRSTLKIHSNFLTNVTGCLVGVEMSSGTVDIQDNFENAGVLLGGKNISAKSNIGNNGTFYPLETFGGFHLNYQSVSAFTNAYPGTLTGGTYVNFGGANATTPVGSISVTAVSGNSTIEDIGQTFATGDWVVAMGLMRATSSAATVYVAALTSANAGAGNSSEIRVARNGALGEWVFVCHFVQVTSNSGGNGRMRWVTSGDVDIAQTYVYKVASPTLLSTPIFFCLPE